MDASTPTKSAEEQYLSFQMPEGVQAMLATSELIEILKLNLSQIVPIPDMAPEFMGVHNWRGEVLWLIDLGLYLGFKPLYDQTLHQGKLSIVVVKNNEKTLGFGVDQVDQMLWCNSESIQPYPTQNVSAALKNCLHGGWSNAKKELVHVLDVASILKSFE